MFDVRCSMFPRFRESLFSLSRMHWDHEPTPNPSQEGNRVDADECLFPSGEGSGVGRFMESTNVCCDLIYGGLLFNCLASLAKCISSRRFFSGSSNAGCASVARER